MNDHDAALAELAGGFIHEIKNHLSTLGLNLSLLGEDFQNPETHRERRACDRVRRLQGQCERLVEVSNDFLRYARLRDFDLQRRLFRYPLSYMIYSEIFDAMPAAARNRVYQRLYDVLSGKDQNPKFAHLSASDRRAIIEILVDTKPDLPDYLDIASKSRITG